MQRRILCFGDSNTWGYNAEDESRFEKGVRWTSLLQEALGEEYDIIEEGLSGRTASCDDPLFEGLNGYSYIYPCIMSHRPLDLIIITLGTNDAKERFALTPLNIAMGIIRLAGRVKNTMTGRDGKDPEILIVAPAPIGPLYKEKNAFHSMGRESDLKTKEMIPFLHTMAKEAGYHFISAGNYLSMGEVDHMHLNAEGHKKMAELLEKKILEIFKARG